MNWRCCETSPWHLHLTPAMGHMGKIHSSSTQQFLETFIPSSGHRPALQTFLVTLESPRTAFWKLQSPTCSPALSSCSSGMQQWNRSCFILKLALFHSHLPLELGLKSIVAAVSKAWTFEKQVTVCKCESRSSGAAPQPCWVPGSFTAHLGFMAQQLERSQTGELARN